MLSPDSFPKSYTIAAIGFNVTYGGLHTLNLAHSKAGEPPGSPAKYLGVRSVCLSPRQLEAAHLAAAGDETKIIARKMGVTYGTAKEHLRYAMAALGVDKRCQIASALDGVSERARPNGKRLTPKQWEILGLVAAGDTSKRIGIKLNMSEATVKTHLLAVYRRVGATNRASAVAWYLSQGKEAAAGQPGLEG